ncbi:uncharacterized protein SCODWIG_03680 [Saccharomycodes ludwigii]|uniref:DUF4536 domain-containing protein n=1 Tax=Saccharomycodes ludwigii TaxID=36035 RepID=A0A376BBG3_9ASCO|nr:hypothetical protein SCDLUD_000244 [Saccharomycodes ludwigii]KAH3902662.1 hypothetical protein SCDLUD_000244 [Saccharomycodes ludwigii]SSD61919.1 uncharacterized protein SCODWIG_03680 [Saccharomycodes ludwigii]
MSNILNVFNPPPSRDLTPAETRDCIPCKIMSTLFALGFGTYLYSGKATEYGSEEIKKGITLKEFSRRNPTWWKYSLKGIGGSLIFFGLLRGSEGWLWNIAEKKLPDAKSEI